MPAELHIDHVTTFRHFRRYLPGSFAFARLAVTNPSF